MAATPGGNTMTMAFCIPPPCMVRHVVQQTAECRARVVIVLQTCTRTGSRGSARDPPTVKGSQLQVPPPHGRHDDRRSCGIRGVEVRNRRTPISKGNSVQGSGESEAFSRNGVHRDQRPAAVRTGCTLVYRVPTSQLTPNPLEAKLGVRV